jgi:type I restriction enzyme, R subunit
MARLVILLRGINIGSRNRISMPELRTALEDGGYDDVRAKLFSDQLEEALACYDSRQLRSRQIIERLTELAREMREARHRHEVLGLTAEEVAFYDALAGGSDEWVVDPQLADIARDLVASIRADLSVDWADHESTEAAIRTKIKHLLRRHRYRPPSGGGRSPERKQIVDSILEQARDLYRFWPEIPISELPV